MVELTRKQKDKIRSYTALAIVLLLIIIVMLLSGCSREDTFNSYKQVSDYCYAQNLSESCGLEKCIMLNSAEFNDQVKFSAEKNYYQCELLNCGGNVK